MFCVHYRLIKRIILKLNSLVLLAQLANIFQNTGFSSIRIRTRGGIYGKIWPEPGGLPEGIARGQSQGLRPYFTVYPDLSPNTDIIPFLTMNY